MKKKLYTSFTAVIFILCFSGYVSAQPYYVSATGSDSNAGTESFPFLSLEKAISKVSAGQTVYVRGGTYNLTTTITLSISGTAGAKISLLAYPGERPVLDFTTQSFGSKGVKLTGNYWIIKGFDITGAGDNGMNVIGGSYNIIENCSFYRNRDSGLQLDTGAAYDTIVNCDSYFNADPTDYGDADGFAPKLTVGTGIYFYGCRSWRNCDDGWDGYMRGADDVLTTAVNCWAFENGYFEDGTDAGVNANGNGFKMGGSDDKTLKHDFVLKQCLAFNNKAKGFDQNNNKGSMTLYNCSGYNNLVATYRIKSALADGEVLIVKNCLDLDDDAEIGSFAEQQTNSWLSPFVITTADFLSIDATEAKGARKSDGSLPDIIYMHLVPGSDMVDAGVDVGLPYAGTAPDLGCFETSLTGIGKLYSSTEIHCYPNPVSGNGIIFLNLTSGGRCEIRLFDITGRYVRVLANEIMAAGEQYVNFDISDIPDGVYIYRIKVNSQTFTGKLVKSTRTR